MFNIQSRNITQLYINEKTLTDENLDVQIQQMVCWLLNKCRIEKYKLHDLIEKFSCMTRKNNLFTNLTKPREMNFLKVAGTSFLLLCATPQFAIADTSEKDAIAITQQAKVGTITGLVTDTNGEPVIGASVLVKGTSNGTITDINGNYSLSNVPAKAILEFSYIGMQKQEINTAGKTVVNITLKEDAQALDEVVVTALGLKREQKALGYAVTEVKGDALRTANTISPVASLQGKVAGVEIKQSDGGIFGATKIQIRGASTLKGNNQPIYVIDGVILDNSTSGNSTVDWDAGSNNAKDYGNELKNLNPDDFETVSVLKGAAATALYGSRGLNGAVVITTKSGKGGKGFGVSFSQTLGIDHAFKTPDIQTEFGIGLIPGWKDTDKNGNVWDPYQFTVDNNKDHTLIGASYYGYGGRYDGSPIRNYDGTWTTYSPHKNNMLDMYDLGFNTNTNVSIRGGNDVATFYSSISYKKANSTTPNNTFERYSFLVKGTYKISKKVDVAASVNFANSTPRNAQRNVGELFVNANTQILTPLYDSNYFRDKYAGEHGGIASSSYGDLYAPVPQKGYWFAIDNNTYYQKETVIRPQFEVNVQMMDWLRFKADANMNYYYTRGEDKQLGSGYANDGGYYGMWQNSKEQTTFGGTFTASKQLNDFYIGGFTRFEYYNNYQSAYSINTDGGMVVPGQWFVDNSKNPKKSSGKIEGTKRIISAIFAVNLSWKNQLYLDITGRNDWSSALVYSIKTGNHSYFYPSVSGSWLVSETFKLPSWVSFAKLRGSWAQVGNDTDPYSINQTYGFGTIETPTGNIYTNTIDKVLKDKSLKPERKNSWELGLDFRAFNNRIGLDFTYYKENTTDQIMNIKVPSISGVDTQKVNAGNIQNSGIEVALNTTPFKNANWQWDLNFTYTKNTNKIISLHENVASYIELSGYPNDYDYHIGSVARVGGDYGILMSDILPAKNEKGETLLEWDEGWRGAYEARSGKVEEVGKMTPDFLGSIATNLSYKNWNLYIATDMRFGGLVASYSNLYGTQSGWLKSSLAGREGHGGMTWTSQYAGGSNGITYHDGVIPEGVFKEGTNATFIDGTVHDVSGLSYAQLVKEGKLEPTHAGTYNINRAAWGQNVIFDTWVHELSYVALREITLSYQFPKTIASKLGMQKLGLSLSARNLGYLYNSLPNNLNPESGRGNTSSEFRIRGFEPYTANYMMTINVDF